MKTDDGDNCKKRKKEKEKEKKATCFELCVYSSTQTPFSPAGQICNNTGFWNILQIFVDQNGHVQANNGGVTFTQTPFKSFVYVVFGFFLLFLGGTFNTSTGVNHPSEDIGATKIPDRARVSDNNGNDKNNSDSIALSSFTNSALHTPLLETHRDDDSVA